MTFGGLKGAIATYLELSGTNGAFSESLKAYRRPKGTYGGLVVTYGGPKGSNGNLI